MFVAQLTQATLFSNQTHASSWHFAFWTIKLLSGTRTFTACPGGKSTIQKAPSTIPSKAEEEESQERAEAWLLQQHHNKAGETIKTQAIYDADSIIMPPDDRCGGRS